MTREEAIARIKDHKIIHKMDELRAIHISEALDMAIKALEQEPCEDCISRQAAVDCFKKWQPYMATRLLDFEKELSELPSVTPQPKMRKWIIIDDCEQFIAKCSECGRIEDSRMISKYPYCHCGAKMEVGERQRMKQLNG